MLAVDFGTSRVKVAYLNDGIATLAPIGKGNLPYIPSLFYLGREGEILVGDEAEDMLSHDPKGVVETLKRNLRDTKIRKNKQKKTPQELVELLFKTVRELVHEGLPHIFTEAPTEVVLTYPAAYTTPEQQLIQTAAQNAGFKKVELITEPEVTYPV